MWFFLQFLKGIRCCLSPKVKAKVWFLKTSQFLGKQAEATPYIALQDIKLEPWKYEKNIGTLPSQVIQKGGCIFMCNTHTEF